MDISGVEKGTIKGRVAYGQAFFARFAPSMAPASHRQCDRIRPRHSSSTRSASPNTVHLEHFNAITFAGAEARRMARTISSVPAGSRIPVYTSLGVVGKFFPARNEFAELQLLEHRHHRQQSSVGGQTPARENILCGGTDFIVPSRLFLASPFGAVRAGWLLLRLYQMGDSLAGSASAKPARPHTVLPQYRRARGHRPRQNTPPAQAVRRAPCA